MTDLATIGFKAETGDLTKAGKALDELAVKGEKAEREVSGAMDKMAASAERTSKKIQQDADRAEKAASNRSRSITNNIGYQVQDALVQAQAGASASVILAQQGSQLASAFNPLLGLFVAVASIAGGALYQAFKGASSSAEDLSDKIKELNKDYSTLTEAQRKFLIDQENAKKADLNTVFYKQKQAVDDLQKSMQKIPEMVKAQGLTYEYLRDKTKDLNKARADLSTTTQELSKSEENIKRLNGENIVNLADYKKGIDSVVKSLESEIAIQTRKGDALAEYIADQVKATGADREKIINLVKTKEANEAAAKSAKDALEAEKSRAKTISDYESKLRGALAVQQDQSEAAKVLSDIQNGSLKGMIAINSQEAKRLVSMADQLDYMRQMSKLTDSLDKDMSDFTNNLEKSSSENFAVMGESASKAFSDSFAEADKFSQDAVERINGAFAGMWVDIFEGGGNLFDGLKRAFIQTLAEMAHEALTKPIMLNIQGQMQGSGGSMLAGVGAGGVYALAAAAIISAIGTYNKQQEELIQKQTAEYRQSTQSIGTVLGDANKKSDSISKALDNVSKRQDGLLSVNSSMLNELVQIKNGISGVSAKFAGSINQNGFSSGIRTGTVSAGGFAGSLISGGGSTQNWSKITTSLPLGNNPINEFVGGFLDSVAGSLNKFIYSKSKKIIDSGISFSGSSLAEILANGTIDAFNYATVKTTKKFLGVKYSIKSNDVSESLDSILSSQFADVFANAGDALKIAAGAFGLDFQNYIDKLVIDPQKLSLKGLSGDALTKEIESFFSSTLDNWAGVLVGGSDALAKFQQVGEGAFETVIRLATETQAFKEYADALGLNFNLIGFAAVGATENIAKFAGGFDALTSQLNDYYSNFFTESERNAESIKSLSEQFNNLGYSMPTTREGFRSLVESLNLSTESGQKAFASLIGLSGAFAALIPATELLAQSSRSASDIASERIGLEGKLLQIQGNTAEIRRRELDLLDESNREIQLRIWALIDEKAAADEAAKAAQNLADNQSRIADDLARKMEAIASERYGLETRLLQAQGDTAALRDRELLQLDESNRSILKQIFALEDQKNAAEQAAKYASEAQKAAQDAANEQARLIEQTQNSITSAIKKLRGDSAALNDIDRQRAKNIIANAISTAQAGGSIDAAKLQDAISVVQNIDKGNFGSIQAYQNELGKTLSMLNALGGLMGVPMSSPISAGASTSQSAQILTSNIQTVQDQVSILTERIEKNTRDTADMVKRWESVGMPVSRTA